LIAIRPLTPHNNNGIPGTRHPVTAKARLLIPFVREPEGNKICQNRKEMAEG
jgi:hypothetical protein